MKNLFGYSRVLAVGDIHGMFEKLIKLVGKIRFNPEEDLLLVLGDYIDRGPDSVKCLQYVYDLQQNYPDSVVCLMGNHEVMMASYFMQKSGSYHNLIVDYAESWLDNGGFDTLQQLKALDDETKKRLITWASSLPVQFRYQEFFFCHAGVDPDVPLEVQNEFDMLWRRQQWWEQYRGQKTIVVGHTPVQNNIIMCDTGVYMPDGKLSCVDVLSRKVLQA